MTDADSKFDATPKNLTAGTADQVSTNVYDAGSAKKLFGGYSPYPPVLTGGYKCTAGTGSLSFRVQFVGSDAAALNSGNEPIADSGVITLGPGGSAMAINDFIQFHMALRAQRVAKRYYGCIYTMGTADQDGEVTAVIAADPQTHMPARKAAVPA